jgi:glucuronokinase
MDFSEDIMTRQGYGYYERLDAKLLPRLYVAYREDLGEPTEKFHSNIRSRFDEGEAQVTNAMRYWAGLTDRVKRCLAKGQTEKIGELLNANFDRRRQIYRLSEENLQMVERARRVGASAKFTGSGGAIVGTYKDEQMLNRLRKELQRLKVKVIKPRITGGKEVIRG